jgi:hypothetical protein
MVFALLCVAVFSQAAHARDPDGCVSAVSTFRAYHTVDGEPGEGESVRFDDLSTCLTRDHELSFVLRTVGEGDDRCYVVGKAAPRQPGIYLFLQGDFRLRFRLDEDGVRINEESGARERATYCGPTAVIGSLWLRPHGVMSRPKAKPPAKPAPRH